MQSKCKGRSGAKVRSMIAAAFLTLGIAPVAQATPLIDSWYFEINAAFNGADTSFSSSGGQEVVTSQYVNWGAPAGTPGAGSSATTGVIAIGDARSGLNLGNDPSSGTVLTNSMVGAPTLSVTHTNNPISSTYGTLLHTSIDSTLKLWAVDASGEIIVDGATVSFSIDFTETSNSQPCASPSPPGSVCDDIFVLTGSPFNFEFEVDGNTYYLNILNVAGDGAVKLTPLLPDECDAADADPGCIGFHTREGAATTTEFALVITGKPLQIPEPATLALFGTALAGLGFMRRRKSA